MPSVVSESQRAAGVSPEASSNPAAVQDKRQVEQELKQEVDVEPASSSPPGLTNTLAQGAAVAGSAAANATANAAAYAREKTAQVTGTDPVSVLPPSAQKAIDGNVTTSGPAHVPSSVSESQRVAGVSPEASANPAAVQDKRQLEQELKQEVDVEPASSSSQGLTSTIAQGAAVAGSATANATANAAEYAREKTAQVTGTDPISMLPQSAQRSIDENTPVNTTSYPRVVGAPTSGFSSSLAHPDLHSGVHNNVVGDHLDDPQTSTKVHSSPSQVAESTESAPVAHIPSFGAVDLKAGVHNGVVGSGADQRN